MLHGAGVFFFFLLFREKKHFLYVYICAYIKKKKKKNLSPLAFCIRFLDMDLTGRGEAGEAGGSFRRFVRSGITPPFARVGRRAGWCVHRNAMRAIDGDFGLPWINYIFNEFERLRNKI